MHFPSLLQRRAASAALALAVMLLGAAEAQAQWKWRDSRGQIHLSDTPPPREVPDKDVLQRPDLTQRKAAPPAAPAPAASVPSAAAKAPVDPELEERRKRAEQEQAARTKADEQKVAAVRKENCQRAREQLATMESGQRIARIKADGEREILDDDQRAREARRARDVIAADCR